MTLETLEKLDELRSEKKRLEKIHNGLALALTIPPDDLSLTLGRKNEQTNILRFDGVPAIFLDSLLSIKKRVEKRIDAINGEIYAL